MGRLIIAEFKDNETHPFDEIMEVFRKYPDFQKYKVDYTPTLSFSDLEILPDQRRVHCGKQEVSLTTKEFNLLCYLAANEGRVLTYEQIYQKIWGNYVQDIENNTIGSHVLILSRLVDTFISRISLTMLPVPNPHNTVCVLSWEEARHWQSRSSGYSSS